MSIATGFSRQTGKAFVQKMGLHGPCLLKTKYGIKESLNNWEKIIFPTFHTLLDLWGWVAL
jgi:hypothetical protein